MVASERRSARRLGESSRAFRSEGGVDVRALWNLGWFLRSLALMAVGLFDAYSAC